MQRLFRPTALHIRYLLQTSYVACRCALYLLPLLLSLSEFLFCSTGCVVVFGGDEGSYAQD
jgi:hypothetical protein